MIKTLRLSFLILIITIAIWSYGLNKFVNNLPKPNSPNTTTDAIIVLTGGSKRLGMAIKLLNEQKAKKLFISGVGKGANLTNLLILSGPLPDNIIDLLPRIELGYEAQNTVGNAQEAAKWINKNTYNSIRLVTANYHIQRSMLEFQKLIPNIQIIAHPVFPKHIVTTKWWHHGNSKKVYVSEYNKLLISQFRKLINL